MLEAVKKKVQDEVVFKCRFVNYSPWWGGDHNNHVIDKEGYVNLPDAKEIVGKTLWFMRTYYMRDLYFRTEEKSKLIVRVYGERIKGEPFVNRLEDAEKIARVKLRMRSSKDNRALPVKEDRVRVTVEVVDKGYPHTQEFIKAMLFTLAYIGIGGGGNRGFGRFYPQQCEKIPKYAEDLLNDINGGKILNALTRLNWKLKDSIDIHPTLSDVRIIDVTGLKVLDALICIGNCTLRQRLNKAETWVLGLPRSSKITVRDVKNIFEKDELVKIENIKGGKSVNTGYYFFKGNHKVDRRQSYVVVGPVFKRDKTVTGIALILFRSKDTDNIKAYAVRGASPKKPSYINVYQIDVSNVDAQLISVAKMMESCLRGCRGYKRVNNHVEKFKLK